MNTQEIRQLLEKYYKGESSLEEELILKKYFETENTPEEFSTERALFRFYSESSTIEEPSAGLEERIKLMLDKMEPEIPAKEYGWRFRILTGVAAGILLLIGSYFLFLYKTEPKDTFTNPEIAYNEAVRVLYSVSSRLNKATRGLSQVVKLDAETASGFSTLTKSTSIIEENLKNLEYFQQAIDVVSSPIDYIRNK